MEIRLLTKNEMEIIFIFPSTNCHEEISYLCRQCLETRIYFEMYSIPNQSSAIVILRAFNTSQKAELRSIGESFKAKFPNIKIN